MLPNSFRTRGVKFAFLFGPPRIIEREEASKVHGKICDVLRFDDISFLYKGFQDSPKQTPHGFSMIFERKAGRGSVFRVLLDSPGPLRLLIEYEWPESEKHIFDYLDKTTEAVFDVLGQELQKVAAEVRLRAECVTENNDAVAYMNDHIFKLGDDWRKSFGEAIFNSKASINVASGSAKDDSLANPQREISIEVLQEDRRSLYFELVTQWSQVAGMSPPQGEVKVSELRVIDRKPNEYVGSELDFLRKRIEELPREAK